MAQTALPEPNLTKAIAVICGLPKKFKPFGLNPPPPTLGHGTIVWFPLGKYSQFHKIHQNLVYLLHFWAILDVFGLVLTGEPMGSQVWVLRRSSMGFWSNAHGNTCAIP